MGPWKQDGDRELDAQLRAIRPEPTPELTRAIADRARPQRATPKRRRSRLSIALAGGLSALVLTPVIALGAGQNRLLNFGGLNFDSPSSLVQSVLNTGTQDTNSNGPTIQQYEACADPTTVFVGAVLPGVDLLALVRLARPDLNIVSIVATVQGPAGVDVVVCVVV